MKTTKSLWVNVDFRSLHIIFYSYLNHLLNGSDELAEEEIRLKLLKLKEQPVLTVFHTRILDFEKYLSVVKGHHGRKW